MEESLDPCNPRAGLVALRTRVGEAMRCHQGPLYAQGVVRCHAEKGKRTDRWQSQPRRESAVVCG